MAALFAFARATTFTFARRGDGVLAECWSRGLDMGLFACFDRGGVGGAVPDGFLPQMRADELLMRGTAEAKLGKVGEKVASSGTSLGPFSQPQSRCR